MCLPDVIKSDMQRFLQAVIADPPQTLKPFGLGDTKFDEIIKMLRTIYDLSTWESEVVEYEHFSLYP